MLLTIDATDRTPVYEQIANGIRAHIVSGELREGVLLPTVRQLAADLGVNLNTIATAYRQLQDDGLVLIKPGSGVTVSSRVTSARDPEDLRKPLRTVLTQLLLAGLGRTEIMGVVAEELRALAKGARP